MKARNSPLTLHSTKTKAIFKLSLLAQDTFFLSNIIIPKTCGMVCQYTFGFYSTNLWFVRGLGRCPRWLHMLLQQYLIIWLNGNHFYRSNCQRLQHVSTKRFRISHTSLTVTVLQHTWCIYIGHIQIFSPISRRQSIYSHKPWLLRQNN